MFFIGEIPPKSELIFEYFQLSPEAREKNIMGNLPDFYIWFSVCSQKNKMKG
jgi:hypothetical protein